MKARAEIKREARESLKGRRGLAVGAMLLTAVFTVLLAYIPFVGWLISLFVGTVVTVGCYGLFVKIYRKQQGGIGELFSPFNRYGRALGGSLWMALWLALWGLIFIIPFAIVFSLVIVYTYAGYGSDNAALIALPFLYLLLIPMIVKTYSYFGTLYILADSPDVPATKALDLSKKMMHGNKGKVFVAQLSFIGWYLLIALITWGVMAVVAAVVAGVGIASPHYGGMLGIAAGLSAASVIAAIVGMLLVCVFLAPYVSTTMAGFYDEIKKDAIERGVVSAEDFGANATVADGGAAQASYIAPDASQQAPVQQDMQQVVQTADTMQQGAPPVEMTAQQAEEAVKEDAPPAQQPEDGGKKD